MYIVMDLMWLLYSVLNNSTSTICCVHKYSLRSPETNMTWQIDCLNGAVCQGMLTIFMDIRYAYLYYHSMSCVMVKLIMRDIMYIHDIW